MDALTIPDFTIDKSRWTKVKFGDVAFEPKETVKDPVAEGIEHVVGLEHIDSEDIHLRRSAGIEESTTFTKKFSKGDVLFGRRRAYLKKAAQAEFSGICSGDITVLRAKKNLLPELLPFIVNNEKFFDYAVKHSAGGLSPRVKFKDLAGYEFLLPPKELQAELAELLLSMDLMVRKSDELFINSNKLLEAYIGEITKINVHQYGVETLESLIEDGRPITYGILMPGSGFPNGIPVVKVRDYPSGEIIVDDLLLTTPEIEEPYKRSRLKEGDLLISIRGTVGRVAEVPSQLDGANITQDTARLSLKPEYNRTYIRMILESVYFQKQVKTRTTGLAVQGINLGELKRLKIPIAPKSEQDAIANKIMKIKTAVSQSQLNLTNSKSFLKSLINQVF